MKTKCLWLAALLALCVTTCFAANKVKGNGTIVTRTIQVDEFTDLRLGHQIESSAKTVGLNAFKKDKNIPLFHYTQSTGGASLEISMDENLFSWLDIDQDKGLIRIQSRDKNTTIVPTSLMIRARSGNLKSVEVSGCMNFISESTLKTDGLRISVSGVGDIKLDDLVCGALSCEVSGVGNAYLTGKVDTGSFQVSGVGKIFAYDCIVKELKCEVSGVGKMEVNATGHLSAETSGVGNIRYKGTAKVSSSASGLGNVKRAD